MAQTVQKIDSLNQVLKSDPDEKVKGKTLIELSQAHLRNKPALGEKYALEALGIFRDLAEDPFIVHALIKLANNQMYLGKLKEAEQHIDAALDMCTKKELQKFRAEALNIKAGVFFFKGNLESSQKTLKAALDAYKFNGDTRKAIMINRNLARLYEKKGDFKNAARSQMEGVKMAEKSENPEMRDEALLFLSIFYREAGDLSSAITQLKTYYEIALEKGYDVELRSFALTELARCYEQLKEYGQAAIFYKDALSVIQPLESILLNTEHMSDLSLALARTGKYEKAQDYLQRAIALATANSFNEVLGKCYFTQALLHYENGDYESAKASCLKSLESHGQNENRLIIRDTYNLLSDINRKKNAYGEALQFKNLAASLQDSIIDESKQKAIAKLQVLYDTEKKEQQIGFLEQANQIAALKISQRNTTIVFSFLGLILALLVIILLFRLNRSTRKSNTILKKQKIEIENQNSQIVEQKNTIECALNEKSQLIEEMHHRTKNNLALLEALFNQQLRNTSSKNTHEALLETKSKIQTIQLLHDSLYSAGDKTVPLKSYLQKLIEELSSLISKPKICIKTELDAFQMNIASAVSIGLIVNELITNSIKYAFPEHHTGKQEIVVTTKRIDEERCKLMVKDTGVGNKTGPQFSSGSGLQLIQGLSKQLRGDMTYSLKKGSNFGLTFKISLIKTAGVS